MTHYHDHDKINFFRKLEVDGTVGSSRHFWRKNGDFSMVYLSCLFILTLFNGLSTFVYCQFIRILDLSWTPVGSPPNQQVIVLFQSFKGIRNTEIPY